MSNSIDIIAYPDYDKELTSVQRENRARQRLEDEKKYIKNSQDKITLDSVKSLLGKVEAAELINMASLCGGLCVEAWRQICLKGMIPNYLEAVDGQEIRSKDGDYKGENDFALKFSKLFPEAELISMNKDYPEACAGFAPQPSDKIRIIPMKLHRLVFGDKDNPSLIFDVIPSLTDVDEKNGYPYRLRQGISTIESPFGESGPRVALLDPVSIMLGKVGVLRWGGLQEKLIKYQWHLRILALCIPVYLEEKTRLFNAGQLDRDPAILSRRLLNNLQNPDMDKTYSISH